MDLISVRVSTKMFLDRLDLPIDNATRVNMLRFGAFVRTTAIRSLRRRKKPSQPGTPPSVHSKDSYATLKNIHFHYSPSRRSVIVGPVKTNQIFIGPGGAASGTVPSVLEHGGRVGVIEVLKWKKWRRADLRSKRRNADLPTRVRNLDIEARPFMGPALQKNRPQVAPLWRNSLKAA